MLGLKFLLNDPDLTVNGALAVLTCLAIIAFPAAIIGSLNVLFSE